MSIAKRIFDLAEWMAVLEHEILCAGGELTPALEKEQELIDQAREDGVQRLVGWIYAVEAEIAGLERIRDEIRAALKSQENLLEYIKFLASQIVDVKTKTPLGTVSPRLKREIKVDNLIDLEDRFLRVRKEVNKTAINEALDAGEKIDGVTVESRPTITLYKPRGKKNVESE
jgi:hypothetical protein